MIDVWRGPKYTSGGVHTNNGKILTLAYHKDGFRATFFRYLYYQ